MKIRLSDHFDYPRLLRFTLPSIVMMIFTSIYSVVDGVFVSQFVGTTPFAAINLIMPFAQIMSCVGFMFGTGGSALVSARLGAKDARAANRIFSMLVWIGGSIGVVFAVLSELFMERIALLMGASVVLAVLAFALSRPLAALFSGFNIFGSAFFTALNNGFVSAAISFLRTFLFQIVTVLILPQLFALNGIWYSLFTAELLSVFVTAAFFVRNRRRYAY